MNMDLERALYVAFEAGFKCAENGMNIQEALQAFNKILNKAEIKTEQALGEIRNLGRWFNN